MPEVVFGDVPVAEVRPVPPHAVVQELELTVHLLVVGLAPAPVDGRPRHDVAVVRHPGEGQHGLCGHAVMSPRLVALVEEHRAPWSVHLLAERDDPLVRRDAVPVLHGLSLGAVRLLIGCDRDAPLEELHIIGCHALEVHHVVHRHAPRGDDGCGADHQRVLDVPCLQVVEYPGQRYRGLAASHVVEYAERRVAVHHEQCVLLMLGEMPAFHHGTTPTLRMDSPSTIADS